MRRLFLVVLAVLWSSSAFAVHFTGSQTASNTWTYNLTIDPFDNYSICQANTTITMTGLSGVTAAGPPTFCDVPSTPAFQAQQLGWTPQVLNGGTKVVWTMTGGGSGNFGTAFHINGFTITATAPSSIAPFSTSGFALDGTCPTMVRDISGSVAAPTTVPPLPALSPTALALLAIGLLGAALTVLRH